MTITLPSPVEFGLPDKFAEWRRGQGRAFQQLLHSDKRFVALALPTGVGKGATYLAYTKALGLRTAALTATRGLQDQLQSDFGRLVTDVRGMSNYPCLEFGGKCDDAPCLDGRKCRLRGGGCVYFDKVDRASRADVTSTNYAFWMSHEQSDLGEFDLLVCDEGHEVMEEVSQRLRVRVDRRDELGTLAYPPPDWRVWWRWATTKARQLANEHRGRRRQHYRRLEQGLVRLAASSEKGHGWVFAQDPGGWSWEPLWPGEFTEAVLWRGTPKVIVSSATITRKQLGYLGLKQDQYEWISCPSPFPAHRRQVTIVKGAPRLSAKSGLAEWQRWLHLIDGIADEWAGGQKGIVHSVSYERARWLQANSRWGGSMLLHDKREAAAAVKKFKESRPPSILVSPSVHTGYDFPHEEIRWQVIGKVPFPDTRDPVTLARTKEDKEYGYSVAIAKIAQAAGRGTRDDGDWCKTFIVDGHAGWLLWGNKHLAPASLLDALRNG